MASIRISKSPYRRLFRYASVSRHSIIPSVIANSGSVIYRDIDLNANKYHISYRIRSYRVTRFGILTYLIIFCILTSAQCWHSPRGISVYRHCQTRQCRWDMAQEANQPKRQSSPRGKPKRQSSPRGKVAQEASPRGKVAQEAKQPKRQSSPRGKPKRQSSIPASFKLTISMRHSPRGKVSV
jgi:hypothetical protein